MAVKQRNLSCGHQRSEQQVLNAGRGSDEDLVESGLVMCCKKHQLRVIAESS